MLNRELQARPKDYCKYHYREDGERFCVCPFKAGCDEIRYTYGVTPRRPRKRRWL